MLISNRKISRSRGCGGDFPASRDEPFSRVFGDEIDHIREVEADRSGIGEK